MNSLIHQKKDFALVSAKVLFLVFIGRYSDE